MNTTPFSRPALVILATYADEPAGVHAEVIEQGGRFIARLIDDDAAEVIGLRIYTTEAEADAYARRCVGLCARMQATATK